MLIVALRANSFINIYIGLELNRSLLVSFRSWRAFHLINSMYNPFLIYALNGTIDALSMTGADHFIIYVTNLKSVLCLLLFVYIISFLFVPEMNDSESNKGSDDTGPDVGRHGGGLGGAGGAPETDDEGIERDSGDVLDYMPRHFFTLERVIEVR